MWRRVMMPRARATDEQSAFLSRETKSARREGKKNARRRAASSLPPRPKSDLKSSYVDFDPHCASALDFGTIITFRERRRRRRSGGGEKKKTESARDKKRREEKKKRRRFSLFAFRRFASSLTRAYDFPRGVDRERDELTWVRARQHPEVPVPHQVERAHGSVQRRAQ